MVYSKVTPPPTYPPPPSPKNPQTPPKPPTPHPHCPQRSSLHPKVGGVKEKEEKKKSIWRPTVPPPRTMGKKYLGKLTSMFNFRYLNKILADLIGPPLVNNVNNKQDGIHSQGPMPPMAFSVPKRNKKLLVWRRRRRKRRRRRRGRRKKSVCWPMLYSKGCG